MSRRAIEVVGSLNIDLISSTSRLPQPGETLAGNAFSTGFGGKGANQAVAAARLSAPHDHSSPGKPVRFIGAVGSDQFGRDFQQQLEAESIDGSGVAVKHGHVTGTAVIIVEQATGENRILFHAGANALVRPGDVQLLPADSLVVFQHELPRDTVVEGIRMAKEARKEVILNPAPAFDLPADTYRGLHHLIMNESEAAFLSGTAVDQLHASLDPVAAHFLQRGVENVIITLGSEGVFFARADGDRGRVPARKVKAVDTTAAGDTFVGAYAAHLAQHAGDLRGAIAFANKCASLSVQRQGAQSSVPYFNEVPTDD